MTDSSFRESCCEDCARDADAILAAFIYPCDKCWNLLPLALHDLWHRREERERREYNRFLYQL